VKRKTPGQAGRFLLHVRSIRRRRTGVTTNRRDAVRSMFPPQIPVRAQALAEQPAPALMMQPVLRARSGCSTGS